jgi:hypothetical protein
MVETNFLFSFWLLLVNICIFRLNPPRGRFRKRFVSLKMNLLVLSIISRCNAQFECRSWFDYYGFYYTAPLPSASPRDVRYQPASYWMQVMLPGAALLWLDSHTWTDLWMDPARKGVGEITFCRFFVRVRELGTGSKIHFKNYIKITP